AALEQRLAQRGIARTQPLGGVSTRQANLAGARLRVDQRDVGERPARQLPTRDIGYLERGRTKHDLDLMPRRRPAVVPLAANTHDASERVDVEGAGEALPARRRHPPPLL